LALLPLVDPVAAQNLPWWLFAPASALYGITLGWFLARVRAPAATPQSFAPRRAITPLSPVRPAPAPERPTRHAA